MKDVKSLMNPAKISHTNKAFPDFSESVSLAFNENAGRYVVATKNIQAGEVIAVEDPAISFLDLDKRGVSVFGSACTNCFMRNLDCLPSPLSNTVSKS